MSENNEHNCRIANLYNVTDKDTAVLRAGEIVFYSNQYLEDSKNTYTRMKVGDGNTKLGELSFAEHPKTARLDKNLVYYDATNLKLQYLKNSDDNNDVNVEITDLKFRGTIEANSFSGSTVTVGSTSSTSDSDLVTLKCYKNNNSIGTVSLRCDLNTSKNAVAGLNIYKTVGETTSQGGLHAAYVDTDVLYINNSEVIDSSKNITAKSLSATGKVSGNNLNLNKKIVGQDLGAANAPIQLITDSSSDDDYGQFPLIAIKKHNVYYIVYLYIDSEGMCTLAVKSNNG